MARQAPEDTDTSSVPSYRRRWKNRQPATEGTSLLVLKVFGVLYDAGRPLTREEILDRFNAQLDSYGRAYIEAWYGRLLAQQKRSRTKHRQSELRQPSRNSLTYTTSHMADSEQGEAPYDLPVGSIRPVQRWLTQIFFNKKRRTRESLVCDREGRYSPGPKPPRFVNPVDGRILPFTSSTRQELEQTDHDAGRGYLAVLEWSKLIAHPEFQTAETRAQLLMLVVRRLLIGENKQKTRMPLDERVIAPRLAYLLRVPDTPGSKRALLERILADVLTLLDPKP